MWRILVALVLAVCVWPLTTGVAHSSSTTNTAAAASVQADFNNDGFADLAVGVPLEDVGGRIDAGAVNVLYGSAGKLTGVGSQMFTQNSDGVGGAAETRDFLGSALATGDFNRDGFADLVIGVPGESIGGRVEAGAVNVLYGSAGKLTGVGSQMFTQNSDGVGSSVEAGDGFGFALAAGDFNNDGRDDLAIGAPFEDVGGVGSAGLVNVLYGSAGKLTGVGSQLFSQDSAGVGTAAEGEDSFGSALATGDFNNDTFDDLAVGVPLEGVSGTFAAGAVNVLYGSAGKLAGVGSQLFTQNSDGVGSAAGLLDSFGSALAAGDFDNDTFDDLAVGVPFERAGGFADAGAVNVLYGSAGKLTGAGSQLFTQNSDAVGDTAELLDHFGFTLAAGDFNNDTFTDLAVGVPDEDVGTVEDAGAVNVLYGSAGNLTGVGSQLFTQDSDGVVDTAGPLDGFGFALTAADFNDDTFDDLGVGVPFEDVGTVGAAGAVNALYGSASKLTGVGSQLFTQDSVGVGGTAEESDLFGWAMAASGPQSAAASPAAPASNSAVRRTASDR